MTKAWSCKVGPQPIELPAGADLAMRNAVARAYYELTGVWPEFLFSGWNDDLDEIEEDVAYQTLRLFL